MKSMDNPESIVGMNVFAVFLDELDTLPMEKAWQVWVKSLARARKKVNVFEQYLDDDGEKHTRIKLDENGEEMELENQMIVGSTPEGFRLLYKLFEKEKPDNYTLIQASGYENTHLPKGYYDNLKQIYPDELVEAYINGKFVNMAVGAVYKSYDREKCDTDALYRDGEELHISMDFNVMNMNAVVFVEREPVFIHNPLFQYEGFNSFNAVRHLHDIVDTPELIQVIRERYPRSPIYCYPDASGKNTSSKGFTTSDISLLKAAGFHCKYPNKNPRILDRVQSVNSALKTGLIKVNVRQCEKVAEALEQQIYNKNTELPEKSSLSSIDDINDSFGYFIHMKFPIKRKQTKKKELGGM
ncbi:MAG: terminase [Candidatus Aenigmarchaeota archaeon]|nr:terminase [Candidatus Aenigmarchaeota archaeon]